MFRSVTDLMGSVAKQVMLSRLSRPACRDNTKVYCCMPTQAGVQISGNSPRLAHECVSKPLASTLHKASCVKEAQAARLKVLPTPTPGQRRAYPLAAGA